jgi:putative ABC transport system permease protein
MNLACRDIRHNLLRFFLTCIGLSLLLGIVVTMIGIYRGALDDALRLPRAAQADLWVVEAGTQGPFAEASRISGDTREMISRVYGVEKAGSVTYQSVHTEAKGQKLRLFVVGYELDRPGEPRELIEGRQIMRSHYEMIVDRSAGLHLGDQVPLGTHGHSFTVVGLTSNQVTSAGDPVAYITLLDAQVIQFQLAPPIQRREAARGGPLAGKDVVNAVIANVSPYVPTVQTAIAIQRWKHLSALTQAEQETLVTKFVIERQRKQIAMFMVLLVIVSAVIIGLIIYTLTTVKLRAIATLKLVGAGDWVIIGLIVQQALAMGIIGFFFGVVLVASFKDYFPRRVILLPGDITMLFSIIVMVCLLASALGVRVAVKVDPAKALVG